MILSNSFEKNFKKIKNSIILSSNLAILTTFIFVSVSTLSCKPKEAPPPTPTPHSKEEFLAQLSQILAPLKEYVPFNPQEHKKGGLPEPVRLKVVGDLYNFLQQYGNIPEAKEACKEVAQEVAQWARLAKDQNKWILALACIDVFEMLGAKSYTLQRLKERGEKYISQPKVIVRGFIEDEETKTLNIFIELVDRRTGEVKKIIARPGEEVDGIRIIDIPVKNVVRFEYIPIEGLFFEVEGPKF
ncbi:MAG: hypothetical protein N3G21_09655 [Candidatus Hydrogenedentes bacterium]|nr:hypothetical protein [Candidatus Hydrogenedentota bacterium]